MEPYFDRDGVVMYLGDCREGLKNLPEQSVNCCVTSPPYFGLRDYEREDQIGQEETPQEFVETMVSLFREVRRVLKDDGTFWLNLGDSYAGGGGHSASAPSSEFSKSGKYGKALVSGGIKPIGDLKAKDLIGIPWRVALALQADGWWLRSDIIWEKPNCFPESVTDRCTNSHEYIFMLTKSKNYYFNQEAIQEDAICGSNGSGGFHTGKTGEHQLGRSQKVRPSKPKGSFEGKYSETSFRAVREKRNKRSVWSVCTKPFRGAHFAVYPPELITPCIKAGCPDGGTVLDPFIGSGTTAAVAVENGCKFVGFELNEDYLKLAKRRFIQRKLFA